MNKFWFVFTWWRNPLDILGPIPETIRSQSAQIRSCDPDRPIAFHKRRSRSAHQIEKIRNQTVYCQLNHDINHSLGNLQLKLHVRDWMKNVRLMISIHDVTMGGVATSFMSVDTRGVMASSVHAHSVCSRYNMVWTCHIWQVCVCDYRDWKYTNCWHKTDNVPVNVSQ